MSEKLLQSDLANNYAADRGSSSAWSRELSLLGSAFGGIKEQAQETLKHPQTRLFEAAAGACVTTALSMITHGEAGTFAHAVEGALAASFAKQALQGGDRLITATADAWNSPAHLEQDKATVSSVMGNFVLDSAAFGIGGLGGRALSTRFLLPKFGPQTSYGIDAPHSPVDSKYGDYRTAADRLARLKASSGEMVPVEQVLNKQAMFVPQKTARIAPIGAALATTDLGTCTALSVIDRTAGKQLLAHVDHLTDPALLRQALAPLDLGRSQIYLLEGEGNQFSSNIGVYGSAERVLAALGNDPGVLSNVRFIRYQGPYTLPNIAVQNGKLYATAASLKY